MSLKYFPKKIKKVDTYPGMKFVVMSDMHRGDGSWTDDFAHRMLYGFSMDEQHALSVPEVIRRIEAGDITPEQTVTGGSIVFTPDGDKLKELGCTVCNGVKEAAENIKERIRNDLGL